MTTRIVDMPVLASRPAELEAGIYNLWRRARLHLGIPLRLALPGMAQMVLILDEDSWVVVNENQSDLPILAWVDFQDSHRDNLYKPIPCTLNFYHYMASSLRGKVLTCMERELDALLHDKDDA
ncbi:MAG TPA: hypothetical protein ENI97_14530 [Gammaproteobacteria bacterium]|nr:hypothetical protein [Gammaproteobacteria bacterium]